MFYYLSKLGWFIAAPSNLFILMILFGALLASTRLARTGRALIAAGVALLAVGGFTSVGALLLAPLEARFPEWRATDAGPDGIVILGGAVDTDLSVLHPGSLEVNDAGERILALIALARRYPSARLVFSGGAGGLLSGPGAEADEVRAKIAAYGVDPARLIVETRSRTTYENAVFTRDLVRPTPGERWLIVTSSWHMPRSIGCFRRAGFSVAAHPVDFRTSRAAPLFQFGEASSNLRLLDAAAKEWIGLLAYRLSGRTDALFPAP